MVFVVMQPWVAGIGAALNATPEPGAPARAALEGTVESTIVIRDRKRVAQFQTGTWLSFRPAPAPLNTCLTEVRKEKGGNPFGVQRLQFFRGDAQHLYSLVSTSSGIPSSLSAPLVSETRSGDTPPDGSMSTTTVIFIPPAVANFESTFV